MAILREHVRAESEHDIDALIGGMTPDCFNDVVGALEPFVGPLQTAERYRKHWEGFPDFTVRIRRILCAEVSVFRDTFGGASPLGPKCERNAGAGSRARLLTSRPWPSRV
jgi:hypothetical protein